MKKGPSRVEPFTRNGAVGGRQLAWTGVTHGEGLFPGRGVLGLRVTGLPTSAVPIQRRGVRAPFRVVPGSAHGLRVWRGRRGAASGEGQDGCADRCHMTPPSMRTTSNHKNGAALMVWHPDFVDLAATLATSSHQ